MRIATGILSAFLLHVKIWNGRFGMEGEESTRAIHELPTPLSLHPRCASARQGTQQRRCQPELSPVIRVYFVLLVRRRAGFKRIY
jgi:hypothetical protein